MSFVIGNDLEIASNFAVIVVEVDCHIFDSALIQLSRVGFTTAYCFATIARNYSLPLSNGKPVITSRSFKL